MAEAIVEENPIVLNKFFCHKCGVEIPRVLDDYTCPTCLGGFIEELEEAASVGDDGGDSSDEDMGEFDVGELPSLLNQVNEVLFGLGVERNDRDRTQRTQQLRSLSGAHFENSGPQERRQRRRWTNRSRDSFEPIDHVIQDFIVNLTGVGWGPMGPGGRGNGPVFFLGNPGDYAWGREGLDAIVTQLLNQMDVAGPPPLDKEKIKEIPVSVITQAQADAKLQCSVCWDDFEVGEFVRKLECEHVYHEKCIVPWLELHGTCPICRKSLSSEQEEKPAAAPGSMGLPDLSAFLRAAPRWSSSPPFSSSSSSSSYTNTSTSTSASASSRRAQPPSDNDMDFEFD